MTLKRIGWLGLALGVVLFQGAFARASDKTLSEKIFDQVQGGAKQVIHTATPVVHDVQKKATPFFEKAMKETKKLADKANRALHSFFDDDKGMPQRSGK